MKTRFKGKYFAMMGCFTNIESRSYGCHLASFIIREQIIFRSFGKFCSPYHSHLSKKKEV